MSTKATEKRPLIARRALDLREQRAQERLAVGDAGEPVGRGGLVGLAKRRRDRAEGPRQPSAEASATAVHARLEVAGGEPLGRLDEAREAPAEGERRERHAQRQRHAAHRDRDERQSRGLVHDRRERPERDSRDQPDRRGHDDQDPRESQHVPNRNGWRGRVRSGRRYGVAAPVGPINAAATGADGAPIRAGALRDKRQRSDGG